MTVSNASLVWMEDNGPAFTSMDWQSEICSVRAERSERTLVSGLFVPPAAIGEEDWLWEDVIMVPVVERETGCRMRVPETA